MIENTFCVYIVSALCIQSFVLILSYDASSTIKSKKSKTFSTLSEKKHLLRVSFKKKFESNMIYAALKGQTGYVR